MLHEGPVGRELVRRLLVVAAVGPEECFVLQDDGCSCRAGEARNPGLRQYTKVS